jgi:hypothetical protein
MAKKGATSTAVAVVEAGGAVALPDYLKDYGGPLGTENIGTDDVTIPRIKVGQSMSKEVKDGEIAEGDLFINVTGEIIAGNGERVPFTPILVAKEYILWRPRKDNGGGILARAKPVHANGRVRYQWDKPNTTFQVKVEGKIAVEWKTGTYVDEDGLGEWGSEVPGDPESGPAATAHHNYVVALPTFGNMIAALSLSRTAAKRAKDLNAMLKLGNAPLFARVFTVETVDDSADDHEFKNYKFRPNGFVEREEDFAFFRDIAKSFTDKGFVVDQSDEDTGESTGENKPL